MATKAKVADVIENVEMKTNGKEEQNAFLETARKVLMASIGAFALAQEEAEEFVDRLIERGEIAEKDGRKLLKDMMEKRRKQAEKAEDEITKRVENVLDRMNVPVKDDIDALVEKITQLTKKIEELNKK